MPFEVEENEMPVLIFWLLEGKSEGILEYSNISPVQTELETKQSNFHLAWIYIYHLWPLQLEIVWLCLNLQALYSAALKPLFRLLEWLRQFSVTCLIKFQTAGGEDAPFRVVRKYESVKESDHTGSQLSNLKCQPTSACLHQVHVHSQALPSSSQHSA